LGGQQQLADAVQRITLAAPVAQGRLLHAPADLVDHQRPAVVSHRPHDGRPANPQIAGDRRDRVGVLPTRRQASARARSVSTAEGGSWPSARSRSAPHRPAPDSARSACASTAPPPAATGQVADPDGAPAMGLGPHPTAHTADHGRRGLDLELPLATLDGRGEDLEAVQVEPEAESRRSSTVSLVRAFRQAR